VGFIAMLATRIYAEDREIEDRLAPFGVTQAEFLPVIEAIVGARADAVEDDPVSTPGQFAYIYGTRHMRGLLRSKKYLRWRDNNIEGVRHPDRDLIIVYQNVDLAGSEFHDPRAISGKGAGADRIVDLAQGSLFTREDLDRINPIKLDPVNTGIWFFCVSVDGDNVGAELSLPLIEGKNFKHFIERIFILRPGEWEAQKLARVIVPGAAEFEPMITRRK
jgi:hypothetical protein